MRSIRVLLAGAATFAMAIAAVACGRDLSTQPAADQSAPSYRLAPSPIGRFEKNLPPGIYNATVHFTIDPTKEAYIAIGPHYLYIPAGTLCDLRTSGYGTWFWDAPCDISRTPVTVTAKSYLLNKHPVVEFDTHLRFKPSKDARFDVMLYLRDDNANSKSVITWCAENSSSCVDEAKVAPGNKLNTRFDPKGLYVYRKIQHFSGYNVTGGRECDDPNGCEGGV